MGPILDILVRHKRHKDVNMDKIKRTCILCKKSKVACVLRGGDRITELPGTFSVLQCNNCGLCWTEPQLSPEELAPYYANGYPIANPPDKPWEKVSRARGWRRKIRDMYARTLYNHLLARHRLKPTLRLAIFLPLRRKLRKTLPYVYQPGRALDVGFGRGSFLIGAYKQGWECYGIEPNEDLCEYIRQTLPSAKVINGYLKDTEFSKDFFNFVNMSHVLEHLHDPVRGLDKIYQWLRPEGFLRIKVPIISPLETKVFGSYWRDWDLPRHLYHFNPKTLKRLLRTCGFEIVSFHYEANIYNWIGSSKYIAKEWNLPKRLIDLLDIENKMLQRCLSPLGWFLKATRLSGRVELLATKAKAKNKQQ